MTGKLVKTDPMAEFRRPTGRPCKAGRALLVLPPERAAIIATALAGPEERFPTSRIREVVIRHDKVFMSPDTWRKHRRGQCGCNRPDDETSAVVNVATDTKGQDTDGR